MSTYEPGTVAVATVRGVPNVRIWRTPFSNWVSERRVGDDTAHVDHRVTDVRPLVVLDPDDMDTLDRLVTLFHESWSGCEGSRGIGLAGALRNLEKPPRIPEPGLWGVVSDSSGNFWVCNEPGRFTRTHDGVNWPWVDIDSPILVRDGIEETS